MNEKTIVKRILFPHSEFICLLCPCASALLIYSLTALDETDCVGILSYALSFYALTAVVLRLPGIARFAQRFRKQNPYYLLYASDAQLRINISLFASLGLNAVYAIFQLCLGLRHHSVWFYVMAAYTFSRFSLQSETRSNTKASKAPFIPPPRRSLWLQPRFPY